MLIHLGTYISNKTLIPSIRGDFVYRFLIYKEVYIQREIGKKTWELNL